MKKFLWAALAVASLSLPALLTATPAMAQTAPAASVPVAPAPAPAAAPAPAPAPATPAPAATAPKPAGGTPDFLTYHDPYAGEESDVQNPNRTQDEILSWAQQRATEVLSFSPANIDSKLATLKNDFVQAGWNDYAAYLQSSQLVSMVRDKRYTVSTIVNGDALILNSGTVAGSYHWLIELPLMVTFLHDDFDGDQAAVAGGQFKLVMQIGRTSAKAGVDGMIIESWKMQASTNVPIPSPAPH